MVMLVFGRVFPICLRCLKTGITNQWFFTNTWICARWFFLRICSMVNHHLNHQLEENLLLFPGILSNSKKLIWQWIIHHEWMKMYLMYFLLKMRIFRPVMLVLRGVVSKTLLFPICLRPFTSRNGHLPIMVGVQLPLPETNSEFIPERRWLVQMRCPFGAQPIFRGYLC